MKNKQDKQKEFMALYAPVHDRFVRYCQANAYGQYHPDDLVNESVLKAYEKFDVLQKPEAFIYFLFAIAKNLMRNHGRRQKYRGEYDSGKVEQIDGGSNAGETNMEAEMLYKALDCLPPEQREAVILFDLSGFKIREIMEMQNAGESAVKTRIARGRKQLAALLKEPEIMNN